MTVQEDTAAEFAIYVDGVGPVLVSNPVTFTVGADEPTIFNTFEEARSIAVRVRHQYEQLGLPDVAAKVYVAYRTVRVIREEWRRRRDALDSGASGAAVTS
ncbi:hypothetical protein A9W98_17850 [Mycobacterium gordonae]|uniref:Uncharacterized protein n=1 Tax=Mycobacterium gordonae TaxID=1778 RepID=A0A1A6BHZ9_MYCGO|nr:hypothetical protein [Mycobacterium gordonae]OBS01849.1 hypothetical protein A9W98_17850 [Mycobacterium gordonae]